MEDSTGSVNGLCLGLRTLCPLPDNQCVDGEEEGHQARQGNGQVDEDDEDAYGLAGVGSEDGLQIRVAPKPKITAKVRKKAPADATMTIP